MGEMIDPNEGYPTHAAMWIFKHGLPVWQAEFLKKNEDYGDTGNLLGSRGQFSDMWRKMGKLKQAMWDDKELHGEQPMEILSDMIGHCFLAMYYMDQELAAEAFKAAYRDSGNEFWTGEES